ncbi:MAG: MBL fold metallo-hydrolase [Actinomycetota bacterium]|nr:MBL fold metallo-hydrolase [Actinomycetota bacterium]
MTTGEAWQEVGDRVFVRRHASLDLNCGLVVGDDACLVIDTRLHLGEAADLIGAIRMITRHPWTVVNTHAHWDHCFGNAAFRPAQIWGHVNAAADLATSGELQRVAAVQLARAAGWEDVAQWIDAAPIDPPDRLVDDYAELIIGGRGIDLRFLGRGHTDGDLVVEIDCGSIDSVLFAGDLVEEGNPPGFDDAYPFDWAATLGRMHGLARGPVVPGHGAVVDADFVAAQRADLLALENVIRETLARPPEGLNSSGPLPNGSPYDPETTRLAVRRAERQLHG